MTFAPTMVSSADVTSSHSITSGSAASARARLTRCFCPPESSWGKRTANSARRSTIASNSAIRASFARPRSPRLFSSGRPRISPTRCFGLSAVSAIW